jgi:ribosome-associated toxin RatA of RatAB toxin-antitoxin module
MRLVGLRALGLCAASVAASSARGDEVRVWTEPVPGSAAPFYVAEGTVDAAPARVWALVSRCADYTKNMPSIAASEELSREGDERSQFTAICRTTADVPFPFSDLTSVTRATMTVEPEGGYSRRWKMIEGDYEVNEGSWQLVPLDHRTRTRVTYRIHAVPKLHLPDSLITAAQERTLPQVIERLRERTAQGAQR